MEHPWLYEKKKNFLPWLFLQFGGHTMWLHFSTFSFPEKINDQNTSNTVTLAKTIERSGKHSSAIFLEVHCLLAACISVSVTH